MKGVQRVLIIAGCVAVLAISWLSAVTATTDSQRQAELLEQAHLLLEDEIYIRAIPLLEEAAGYDEELTLEAEEILKDVYLHMMDKSGYARKYTDLLAKQMERENAQPEIFLEAAQYYFNTSEETDALAVLRDGIEKTGNDELLLYYEQTRYMYTVNNYTYEDVTATYNGAIQVKMDGLWGLATADGSLGIPCEYDAISTFDNGQAIVRKGDVISAVDSDNNRVALLHGRADTFSNFSNNRVGLEINGEWVLADGNFNTGGILLEGIGMFSEGYAPAKLNGRWGVLSTDGEAWMIAPEYDEIIQDKLGRCYDQGAVFARKGSDVWLYVDGEQIGDAYEDAEPFSGGWAAVKKDGKWGFIDRKGVVQIDYQFDQALSFSQHLAAVSQDGLWGYVSLYGEMVIEPIFLSAGSFYEGSAPVQTADGWQFISLLEYEEGTTGLL